MMPAWKIPGRLRRESCSTSQRAELCCGRGQRNLTTAVVWWATLEIPSRSDCSSAELPPLLTQRSRASCPSQLPPAYCLLVNLVRQVAQDLHWQISDPEVLVKKHPSQAGAGQTILPGMTRRDRSWYHLSSCRHPRHLALVRRCHPCEFGLDLERPSFWKAMEARL